MARKSPKEAPKESPAPPPPEKEEGAEKAKAEEGRLPCNKAIMRSQFDHACIWSESVSTDHLGVVTP